GDHLTQKQLRRLSGLHFPPELPFLAYFRNSNPPTPSDILSFHPEFSAGRFAAPLRVAIGVRKRCLRNSANSKFKVSSRSRLPVLSIKRTMLTVARRSR